MAAVYAVRRGAKTGKFPTWNECAKHVLNFPGADYRKCMSEAEADEYLGTIKPKRTAGLMAVVAPEPVDNHDEVYKNIPQHILAEDEAVAYTSGSFKDDISGSAVVFVTRTSKNAIRGASVGNSNVIKHRSLASKVLAVVMAINEAKHRGIKKLTLVYDYFGIQEWAKGTWSTKTKLSQRYYEFIQTAMQDMTIDFIWLGGNVSKTKYPLAHSADECAKQAVENYVQCSISDMVTKFFEEPAVPSERELVRVGAETAENSDIPF